VYSVAAIQHNINHKKGVTIFLSPWLVVSVGSITVTTEEWTITRVLAASWLGSEIDALVGGKEAVIASSCAARSSAARCSTVGAGRNKPAHASSKKELKTSNKLGILALDDPLVAVFEGADDAEVAVEEMLTIEVSDTVWRVVWDERVPIVMVLPPSRMHSRLVFATHGPGPDRIGEGPRDLLEIVVSVLGWVMTGVGARIPESGVLVEVLVTPPTASQLDISV
jgi:hypothetical protein